MNAQAGVTPAVADPKGGGGLFPPPPFSFFFFFTKRSLLAKISIKEPFSPHGRGLVAIVYVVKRSFQFDMRQDTGRHMSCERAKVHMQSLAY